MVKSSHLIAVVVALLVVLMGTAWGGDRERHRQSLRGIKGVNILIEEMPPLLAEAGLTKNQIVRDVELKLRLVGLKVLSQEESFKISGSPFLYVSISAIEVSCGFVFSIKLAYCQDALLIGTREQANGLETWSVSSFGITPNIGTIKSEMKDHMDTFLNAWLSVNPRQQ